MKLVLSLAIATSIALPAAAQEAGCCALYPPASGPLVIEIGAAHAPSFLDVANQYAELTGHHLLMDEATRTQLGASSTGLARSVTVAAADVQSFFEHLCTAGDVAAIPIRTRAPRLMRLQSQAGAQRAHLPARSAVHLDEKDLPHMADHPATLVSATIHLPNTDVRQLTTSIRALLLDGRTQNISPAGQSNNLVITAFGAEIANLAAMLRRIDTASREPAAVSGPAVEVLQLQNAEAYEVANALTRLFSPSPPADAEASRSARGPRFVVDERLNSVIVYASSEELVQIRALVAQLDARAENNG